MDGMDACLVKPALLSWAIARAGEAGEKYVSKHVVCQKWIDQEKTPTFKQLEDFAKGVYVPFGYLFLSEPPKEDLPITFFRSEKKGGERMSLNVYDTILILQDRQTWLRSFFETNEYDKCDFVGKFNSRSKVNDIASFLRCFLNLDEEWAKRCISQANAVSKIVDLIEDKGVCVSLSSCVQNNINRQIKVDECRGFALSDDYAPYIFVNANDSKTAQLFTLIHELVHILLNYTSGTCLDSIDTARLKDRDEVLCDKVAAEFLVPDDLFATLWGDLNKDIRAIAKKFKVSEIVILRKAKDAGFISEEVFWKEYHQMPKVRKIKHQSVGGDFYATAKRRISYAFLVHINAAVRSDQLLYTDAYSLTGLKGKTFDEMTNKL